MKKWHYPGLLIVLILRVAACAPNAFSQSAKGSENSDKIRVGLYGIGLDTYWPQFEGLYERLQGYQNRIAENISRMHPDIELLNTGIVDHPMKARQTGKWLAAQDVEAVFLYISTYALSSTVLPVVQKLKVPVIVLSLQPEGTIDYERFNAIGDRGKMTGEWLAYCQACSAPEIAGVFQRAGIDYHLITGALDDQDVWHEIKNWIQAIRTAHEIRDTRVGTLGHYYGGMMDVYSDMTQLASVFGCHFEIVEMSSLLSYRNQLSRNQIQSKMQQFKNDFEVSPACSQHEITRAAKTSAALDELVRNKQLHCLAYYYEGSEDPDYSDITGSVIPGFTYLTMHGVPVAGEYEIKNVIAMKIMDILGVGGSFSEFYLMDLEDDVVLLGHDGPGHARIAQGKVRLVPLPVYHGKPGKGLSIQMSVKLGPVTLFSVVQGRNGRVKFLVAEGESVAGPVLEIGNTNSRYRFSPGAKQFIKAWSEQGPAHHMAVGVGHVADQLDKLAKILGIDCIQVGK